MCLKCPAIIGIRQELCSGCKSGIRRPNSQQVSEMIDFSGEPNVGIAYVYCCQDSQFEWGFVSPRDEWQLQNDRWKDDGKYVKRDVLKTIKRLLRCSEDEHESCKYKLRHIVC